MQMMLIEDDKDLVNTFYLDSKSFLLEEERKTDQAKSR